MYWSTVHTQGLKFLFVSGCVLDLRVAFLSLSHREVSEKFKGQSGILPAAKTSSFQQSEGLPQN